jgi:hypothetical protein
MDDVIAGIRPAGIVADPLIVAVDMGCIRVSVPVAIVAVLIVLKSRTTVRVMRGR